MSFTLEKTNTPVSYILDGEGNIMDCNIYYQTIVYSDNKNSEISLNEIDDCHDSWLFPYCVERPSIFIAGRSGAGKSHFIRNYAQLYLDTYPDRRVFIITNKDSDITLDRDYDGSYGEVQGKLDYTQILMNEDTVDVINWENIKDEITNSLVLFDDAIYTDKKVIQAVNDLQAKILNLGRDRKIGIIISKHILQDAQNRIYKNGVEQLVIYPQYSSTKHIRDWLKGIGFDKSEISKVVKSTSRWVCINLSYPKICIDMNNLWKQ